MDEQITQLDRRLSAVEREVTVLAADAASARPHYATREDVARLDARVAVIQSNYVVKEDILSLDLKLSGQIADLKLYLAKLEVRMMRWTAGMVVAACSVMTAILKIWP